MSQVIKIISFVPSWTETLIEAGIFVVGRTRYCIHPAHIVEKIPIVGGTKKILIDECIILKPDLIIFDQEENNLEMTQLCDQHNLKWMATHVVNLQTCGEELIRMSEVLQNEKLKQWGHQYLEIAAQSVFSNDQCAKLFQSMILKSVGDIDYFEIRQKNIQYLIWDKPLMTVSRQTFIGDVLAQIGLTVPSVLTGETKYPVVISPYVLKKSFCLFSSEPYPFAKFYDEFIRQGFTGSLIDGEKVSWYGIRCLWWLRG